MKFLVLAEPRGTGYPNKILNPSTILQENQSFFFQTNNVSGSHVQYEKVLND